MGTPSGRHGETEHQSDAGEQGAPRIRVVLADDHPLLRLGLCTLLNATRDIAVVAEADNGEEALRLVARLNPDVLVLDMSMPGLSGDEAARRLKASGSPVRVLTLSAYLDDRFVFGAIDSGAAGYLLKDEAPSKLVEAVRGVAHGEGGWFSRRVAEKLAQRGHKARRSEEPLKEPLTEREIEVLALLARGLDNVAIADALSLADGTVKNHVSNV